MDKEKLFSDMPVSKAVLTLAVPTVISQLITVVYNMADTFFISRLNDPYKVAAATIAMPCFMFLTAFANLFGIGGASLISRSLGINNYDKARKTASFSIWSGAVVSIIYGILIYVFRYSIFPILGVSDETWEYLESYMFWTVTVGALPTVMNSLFSHLVRSEGYSKQAGFGVALGGVLNIVLDPIFIFALGMDIEGAAIATMLSNVVAMIYFIIFIIHNHNKNNSVIGFNIKDFTLKHKIPIEVITVGLPGFFMTMMSTVSNIVLNKVVASYSDTAIAGMGIAKKIDLLAYAITQGMTQGVLPLIGFNYSMGKIKRMKECVKTACMYGLIVAIVGTLLLYFCAVPIISAFIDDVETVSYGQTFLKILCLSCPTTVINFMIITVFQATGKKVQPLILSMMRKGTIDVFFVIFFSKHIGVNGIAWATPVADVIALVVSILLFIPFLIGLKDMKETN